jgi:replicative DNA helicase
MNGATTLDAPRELPRDIEAERSALATISLDGSTLAKIRGALTPEHFF